MGLVLKTPDGQKITLDVSSDASQEEIQAAVKKVMGSEIIPELNQTELNRRLSNLSKYTSQGLNPNEAVLQMNKDMSDAEMESAKATARREVAREVGDFDAAKISYGREVDKLYEGTKDLTDIAGQVLTQGIGDPNNPYSISRKERAVDQKGSDIAFDALRRESPISTFIGGMAPYILTSPIGPATTGTRSLRGVPWKRDPMRPDSIMANPGTLVPKKTGFKQDAAKFFRPMVGGTVEGGVVGAAHYDDDALTGAIMSGPIGGYLGRLKGNVMGGHANVLNDQAQDIVNFAKKNDLFVPPGMATGNIKAQQIDGAFATNMDTASKWNQRLRDSKISENRLITKELGGEPHDFITRNYMSDQFDDIGKKMDELVKDTNVSFVEKDLDDIINITENYRKITEDKKLPKMLKDELDRLMDVMAEGNSLDGKQYQAITKEINDAASAQAVKNPRLSSAMREIAEIYHSGIDKSIDPSLAAGWKTQRRRFALAKNLEQALEKSTSKDAGGVEGFVDTQKLATLFKSSDTINKLAEVEKLRKSQNRASLGASNVLAKALTGDVAGAGGSALAVMSKATKGAGPIPDVLTSLYLTGWPHNTGMLPIFGREYTQAWMENMGPRMMMGNEKGQTGKKVKEPKIPEWLKRAYEE